MLSLLPKPPSNAELQRHTPTVAPVPDGVERPFWSVMIPTYNCAHYLREALKSVLVQDPGPKKMHIEVVDDHSTKDDPEAVVRELGKGRVQFYRRSTNGGSTGIFNACVQRSIGHWVHMLHADDLVLPGFYEAGEKAVATFSDAVMVFSQTVIIKEDGRVIRVFGPKPEPEPAVLQDFVVRLAVDQQCQFATVAVRRSAYEKVGGFCLKYDHVPDWDMWMRIGLVGKVVLLPQPYGHYRVHDASVTSHLMVSATNIRERAELILVNLGRLPAVQLASLNDQKSDWRVRLADEAEVTAWDYDRMGNVEGRLNQMRWAFRLGPTRRRLWDYGKSWLKARLNGTR